MTKAIDAHTTGASIPHPLAGTTALVPATPSTPRRSLLTGTAAALAAGVAAFQKPGPLPWRGGPRPKTGDDAALLAMLPEWRGLDAFITSPAYDPEEAESTRRHDRWWQIVHRVTDTPARTPEGRAAKAEVLRGVLRDCADHTAPDGRLALSLIRDHEAAGARA
jgi:hypothetical protein